MSSVRYASIQDERQSPVFPPMRLYPRVAGYIILEGGFLTLAALALTRPLSINTFLGQTEGRATFTVIFILWQYFAIKCLDAIIQHIFASEWDYIAKQSHTLDPGTTDRVSTPVSGLIDFIPHFFTPHSSRAFKLALPAQLISLAIRGLLPGVFTTGGSTSIHLAVANLTGFAGTSNMVQFQSWAELAARLEIRDHTTFGFDTEKNWIVGWPDIPKDDFNFPISYPTDVIYYDFKCHWEAPNFISQEALGASGDQQWRFSGGLPNNWLNVEDGGTFYRAVSQLNPMPGNNTYALLAFLFFGSNGTYHEVDETGTWGTILNLEAIPATYNETGFDIEPFDGVDYHASAPLAALLVCDPQIRITSGRAVASPNGTLSVIKSSLGTPGRLNNIPDLNVKWWFAFGSVEVFQGDEWDTGGDLLPLRARDSVLNFNSAWTFLNDSSLSPDPLMHGRKGIFPLPIEQIQDNLNTMFQSISKSFSNGTGWDMGPGALGQATILVEATTQSLGSALTASINLFCIGIVLVNVELILIGALCVIVRDWQYRAPLNLGSVFAATGKEIEHMNFMENNLKRSFSSGRSTIHAEGW